MLLLFCIAYVTVSLKRPKNYPVGKYVLSIIGIWLFSFVITIMINLIFDGAIVVDMYGLPKYPEIDLVLNIISILCNFFVPRFLLKTYKDGLYSRCDNSNSEEKNETD